MNMQQDGHTAAAGCHETVVARSITKAAPTAKNWEVIHVRGAWLPPPWVCTSEWFKTLSGGPTDIAAVIIAQTDGEISII